MERNKRGISLIVLVITIIVMIILAGAVIISLGNAGIIGKAQEAVDANNLKQVQQLAALAWSEAYIDIMEEELTETEKQAKLEAAVDEALEENEVNKDLYDIEVTTSGVSVKAKGAAEEETPGEEDGSTEVAGNWTLQKTVTEGKVTEVKVTNGTEAYDVGTVINYMPNGVGPTTYTGGWKILGVDEQGRLLIMSSASITGSNVTLGGSTLAAATQSYLDALTTLQTAVDGYKDGTIGVEVRSVKVEDIDALTSFDKTTYGTGINKYGNEVTYTWDGTDKPAYSYGTPATTGNLSLSHSSSGFTYYDAASGEIVTSAYTTTAGTAITTLKSDFYYYTGSTYLDSTTAAYTMAFNSGNYWLV